MDFRSMPGCAWVRVYLAAQRGIKRTPSHVDELLFEAVPPSDLSFLSFSE